MLPASGRRKRDLTDEERQEIREAFELFDTDKDGALDYHEFKVCRSPAYSASLTRHVVCVSAVCC